MKTRREILYSLLLCHQATTSHSVSPTQFPTGVRRGSEICFLCNCLTRRDEESGGEVLALDAACWAYRSGGAGGEATQTAVEEEDIAKEIKEAIKKIK